MNIIDNTIILLLILGAFLGGLKLAGKYYKKLLAELQWLLKVMIAENGLGYIAPPQEEPSQPISQMFMDHLKKHGKATQAIRTSRS